MKKDGLKMWVTQEEEMRGITVNGAHCMYVYVEREQKRLHEQREEEEAVTCQEVEEGGRMGCQSLGYVTETPPSLLPPSTTTHMTAAALFCNSSHEDRVVLQ